MKKESKIISTVKIRKKSYYGLILRSGKYELMRLFKQRNVEEKIGPEKRRTSWLKNLKQWSGQTAIALFRKAADRMK